MHIINAGGTVSAISHKGERYEPDAEGIFEVPDDLGEHLLETPAGWYAVAAPAPAEDKPAPKARAPRKPKAE